MAEKDLAPSAWGWVGQWEEVRGFLGPQLCCRQPWLELPVLVLSLSMASDSL